MAKKLSNAAHEAGVHDTKRKPADCAICAKYPTALAEAEGMLAEAKTGQDRDFWTREVTRLGGSIQKAEPEALPAKTKTRVNAPKTRGAAVVIDSPAPVVEDAGFDSPPAPSPIPGDTREAWMLRAIEAFRPWFENIDLTIPPLRVSIGWPAGRSGRADILGQCFIPEVVADRTPALFVSPVQSDPAEIIETLVHECLHATGFHHHRSPFQRAAHMLGFQNGGKTKTSRGESPDLYKAIAALLPALGPFPHSAIAKGGAAGAPKVQTTRMRKVECPECGYTVRTTSKWLAIAIPQCPVDETEMEVMS